MSWWNPLSWFGSSTPEEIGGTTEPILGEGWVDNVFDLRHRYFVSQKPAGFFDGHPKGEGSYPYVILRTREGALPAQRESYEVDVEDSSRTPEGHLPTQLMKLLKRDMHIRRYAPLWGFTGLDSRMIQAEHLADKSIGEIGQCFVADGQAAVSVTLRLPKGQARHAFLRSNLEKAVTWSPQLETEDLVSALRVELADEFTEYDRESVRLIVTADLKVLDPKTKALPQDWRGTSRETRQRRIVKLTDAFLNDVLSREAPPDSPLKNVRVIEDWTELLDAFELGSEEDFTYQVKIRDTRRNAIFTVGTGFTFAVIQNAINAAASGDVIEVYGNGATPLVSGDYNENVTDNALDGIQLIGMLTSADGIMPAIRIHANAGQVVTVVGNDAWHMENFEIDGEGSANVGIQMASWNGCVARCVAHDCVQEGIDTGNDQVLVVNCISYDNGIGFDDGSTVYARFVHCTAVDNTVGFNGPGVGDLTGLACLAAENGTDYVNAAGAAVSAWNVSSDLTAPGSAPQTGFNNADFINYAGDNFRLSTANMLVTQALFDGNPLSREDYLGMLRDRDDHRFWAGASHPWAQPTWPAGVSNITQVS